MMSDSSWNWVWVWARVSHPGSRIVRVGSDHDGWEEPESFRWIGSGVRGSDFGYDLHACSQGHDRSRGSKADYGDPLSSLRLTGHWVYRSSGTERVMDWVVDQAPTIGMGESNIDRGFSDSEDVRSLSLIKRPSNVCNMRWSEGTQWADWTHQAAVGACES